LGPNVKRQKGKGRRQKAEGRSKSWEPEAGNWKLEAGSWKLEAGSWKLEAIFKFVIRPQLCNASLGRASTFLARTS
jgi:hypothetical protein